MWRAAIQILLWILPWPIRRRMLKILFGYKIASSAKIGLSLITPLHLTMEAGSWIGHLNICKSLSSLELGPNAGIGHLNWISATAADSAFFLRDTGRHPSLILESNAQLTNRHHLDCTAEVLIGAFATVAGWNSQILTHSIDVERNEQRADGIRIGKYSFVGTRVVVLKSSELPAYSILAAGSVLNRRYQEPYGLYSGCPAVRVKDLNKESAYFSRTDGSVR